MYVEYFIWFFAVILSLSLKKLYRKKNVWWKQQQQTLTKRLNLHTRSAATTKTSTAEKSEEEKRFCLTVFTAYRV